MRDHKHLSNICVVGNIASGKSTLAQLLAETIPNSIAIPESFDQNRFLSLYIADPRRWGFTNAVRYFFDYARVYRDKTAGRTYAHSFIDAGGATNRHVYGRYLKNEGIITPDEHAFYDLLCDIIERAYAYPEPDAYIFVNASPETCFKRMMKRGWDYQTRHVRMEYLHDLRKYLYAYKVMVQAQGDPLLEIDSDAQNWFAEPGRSEVIERVRAFLESGGVSADTPLYADESM